MDEYGDIFVGIDAERLGEAVTVAEVPAEIVPVLL
ncbi:hypothetical protein BH10PSE12_BH10PSE12_23340 [soil metagenome]